MTKQELIELIESLHPEDTKGELTGIFIGRHGEVITTDSIRIDMDGGRVILARITLPPSISILIELSLIHI